MENSLCVRFCCWGSTRYYVQVNFFQFVRVTFCWMIPKAWSLYLVVKVAWDTMLWKPCLCMTLWQLKHSERLLKLKTVWATTKFHCGIGVDHHFELCFQRCWQNCRSRTFLSDLTVWDGEEPHGRCNPMGLWSVRSSGGDGKIAMSPGFTYKTASLSSPSWL